MNIRRILAVLSLAATVIVRPPHAHGQAVDTAGRARRDSLTRAMRHEVIATLAAAGVSEPRGLLLMEGLRAGPELQVRVIEGALPDSALLRVYQLVRDRAAAWPGDTLRMLVRLDPGLPRDGTAEEHQPVLRNRVEIARVMSRFGDPAAGPPGAQFRAGVLMVVSRTGTVPFWIVRESSGNARVDAFVGEVVRRMRFDPARIGSRPVDVWVTLPVTITPGRQ